jgi:hypothetical protein
VWLTCFAFSYSAPPQFYWLKPARDRPYHCHSSGLTGGVPLLSTAGLRFRCRALRSRRRATASLLTLPSRSNQKGALSEIASTVTSGLASFWSQPNSSTGAHTQLQEYRQIPEDLHARCRLLAPRHPMAASCCSSSATIVARSAGDVSWHQLSAQSSVSRSSEITADKLSAVIIPLSVVASFEQLRSTSAW